MINLSICSPVLKVDKYAVELSGSLKRLRNDGLRFEHVVVGPACNSNEVAEVFGHLDSSFCVEKLGTRGVFDAVAQGFTYAIFNWAPTHLSYINADDLLEPGFARALAACRGDENQLITGDVQWIGEHGQSFGKVSTWPWQFGTGALFEAGVPALTQQGTILSASVWQSVDGFDPNYKYIADSVLWHKLIREKRVQRTHVRKCVASYRMRSGQLSGNREAVEAEQHIWELKMKGQFAPIWQRNLAVAFMKLYFAPRYAQRLLNGRILRTKVAMKSGGFSK